MVTCCVRNFFVVPIPGVSVVDTEDEEIGDRNPEEDDPDDDIGWKGTWSSSSLVSLYFLTDPFLLGFMLCLCVVCYRWCVPSGYNRANEAFVSDI